MAIIRTDSRRANHKLVGVSLPSWVHEYLTLYAMAKGTTKTKVLTEKIEAFISLQKMKQTDDELLFDLLQRVKTQWKVRKIALKKPFPEFVEEIRIELLNKGLNKKWVDSIINNLEE